MAVLIFICTTLFVFIAFIGTVPHDLTGSFLSTYLPFQLSVARNNYFLYLLGFVLASSIVILKTHFAAKYSVLQKFIYASSHVILCAIIGFLISGLLLFCIGLIQLNATALSLRIHPDSSGMITNREEIVKIISSLPTPVRIIAGDNDSHKQVLAVTYTSSGKNNFYARFALPSVPGFLVLPINKQPFSIGMIDDTLVISRINPTDLEEISPVIGLTFLADYFENRRIKRYPSISLLNRKDYITVRQKLADTTILEVGSRIKDVDQEVSSYSGSIEQTKQAVTKTTTDRNELITKRNTDHRNCLRAQGSESLCTSTLSDIDKNIELKEKELTTAEQLLTTLESKQVTTASLSAFYKQQEKLLKATKKNFSYEYGAFTPEKRIDIAIDSTNSHSLADYFETVIHEYLHYASYQGNSKKFRSLFFEEGLTEYFARKVIGNELGVTTNIGYPAQIKILENMMEVIPESEFAEIYFTKDQEALEKTIDRVYGDSFYRNNELLYESLMYASSPQQILQIANTLMRKINGKTLTIKDLQSSFTSYE